MCRLEQGDLVGAARFQSITAQCVASGVLGDCSPNCLQVIN